MNGRAGASIPRSRMDNGITRILSIDGGGIKGVMPAAFLAQLEESSGKRLVDHFDIIAGTSTGGIIALGLGLGLPAQKILSLYRDKGPAIFSQAVTSASSFAAARTTLINYFLRGRQLFTSKYKPDRLRDALTEIFGSRTLGQSETRLVIPAYHAQRRQVYIFKTAHHPRFQVDWKELAVDVALATAAAPTYLPSHELPNGVALLDGGVWANNPTALAVVEAIGILNRDPNHIRVLSIGCVEDAYAVPGKAGGKDLLLRAADLFIQGQSKGSLGMTKILIGHSEIEPKLFRYCPIVQRGMFGLDEVKTINALQSLGASLGREALPLVNKVFLDSPKKPFHPN